MNKHPIIANGELYAEPVTKKFSGGPKTLPRDYPEAKQRMIDSIDRLTHDIQAGNEVFLDERIICVRLESGFEAKSYIPNSLFSALSNESSPLVGGRKYWIETPDDETPAKMYFVKTTDAGLSALRQTLQTGLKDNNQQWQTQIQSVNTIDLLTAEEKIMGFSDDWDDGNVEFVLHPIPENTEEEICIFFSQSGLNREDCRIKTYEDGITFISAFCSRDVIQKVGCYNPLRTVHPMGSISITRSNPVAGSSCPSVANADFPPSITIGVFDGGADNTHPLLTDYVTSIDGTSEPPEASYTEHGTGVCSAILYGTLSEKSASDTLEAPCVKIESYRVFPMQDQNDRELYEVIDLIENIVPASHDIKLYNLSIGPVGPILDDEISRFTYALDKLAYEVPENEEPPLFVVAVGNSGDLDHGLGRVQSPSDIVNGIGVGAYTYRSGQKTPALYSCYGPGREGAKTKPDLLDFGGSPSHPFIIPSLDHSHLCGIYGTSFSSPSVTGKIGKLLAMSDRISPHLGRTLLIHNAQLDDSISGIRQGFGYCPIDMEEVLHCTDNHVTIMYSGTITPTQSVRLPIFAPRISEMNGLVKIDWTVATVVAPYANDSDAYTNNCLEDTFYPHAMTYNFSKKGLKTERINFLKDMGQVELLLNRGYKQSNLPVSHPAKTAWTEDELRTMELKWDTIIHRGVRMRSSSLLNPFLTLHAMGRNGFETNDIRYYVVITIDAPRYEGSLYDSVLQTFQNLTPIQIRDIHRIRV